MLRLVRQIIPTFKTMCENLNVSFVFQEISYLALQVKCEPQPHNGGQSSPCMGPMFALYQRQEYDAKIVYEGSFIYFLRPRIIKKISFVLRSIRSTGYDLWAIHSKSWSVVFEKVISHTLVCVDAVKKHNRIHYGQKSWKHSVLQHDIV